MVSISFSCKPELYKKVMELKENIEADRMKEIPLSEVVNGLVKLGFSYREKLRADNEKTKQRTLEADTI